MALKPTLYKCTVAISDLDHSRFEQHSLTLVQHPSESVERMMARLVAFCLSTAPELSFTKGLSTPDEPDIWQIGLSNELITWVDVGEPSADRIKKACRRAQSVEVYTFNSKSETWWAQVSETFSAYKANVFRLDWSSVQRLAACVERSMELSVTISEGTAFFSTAQGDAEVHCEKLQ